MRETMHGDRAAVRVSGTDNRGRPEGAIVEILERNTKEIVGRLYDESGICFVVPDNPRIGHRVLVPRQNLNAARVGQVVLVKLVEQPSKNAQPLGHITRVLGEHAAPGMETDIAIHSHGLPFEFPPEVVAEAEAFGSAVPAAAAGVCSSRSPTWPVTLPPMQRWIAKPSCAAPRFIFQTVCCPCCPKRYPTACAP
jgi:ribonuclease R